MVRTMTNVPKSYYFQREELPLIQFTSTLATCSVWLEKGMEQQVATFDFSVREFWNRNYMLFCGLEEILEYLHKLQFSTEDIKYLQQRKVITPEFAQYLKKFKFSGIVYAMQEGTPFFPGEPIIRITAPLIEAALIEVVIMIILSSNIPFLSKAARTVIAAQDKFVLVTSPTRAHSFESGVKACRAAYIAGMSISPSPIVGKKYNIDVPRVLMIGQHFFIKSFATELSAMQAMVDIFPDTSVFMVDTYDLKQGIRNAIKVAKKLEQKNHKLAGIMIDSGDLSFGCRYARKELDKHKLSDVQIYLATNMDEYKVNNLARNNVPCDVALVVTEYVTLSDSPKLEVVYKVAEVRNGDKVTYTAKLTPGKESYPGKKQVFRTYTKSGLLKKDIIGLENESFGEPLLEKVMDKGKVVSKSPSLNKVRAYTKLQLQKLSPRILDLRRTYEYPVEISSNIKKLFNEVRKTHL